MFLKSSIMFLFQVVSISLDVLINIARVDSTKDFVSAIPNLVPDMFQIMVVFRDAGGTIFSKICALLQILSSKSQVLDLVNYAKRLIIVIIGKKF